MLNSLTLRVKQRHDESRSKVDKSLAFLGEGRAFRVLAAFETEGVVPPIDVYISDYGITAHVNTKRMPDGHASELRRTFIKKMGGKLEKHVTEYGGVYWVWKPREDDKAAYDERNVNIKFESNVPENCRLEYEERFVPGHTERVAKLVCSA